MHQDGIITTADKRGTQPCRWQGCAGRALRYRNDERRLKKSERALLVDHAQHVSSTVNPNSPRSQFFLSAFAS